MSVKDFTPKTARDCVLLHKVFNELAWLTGPESDIGDACGLACPDSGPFSGSLSRAVVLKAGCLR